MPRHGIEGAIKPLDRGAADHPLCEHHHAAAAALVHAHQTGSVGRSEPLRDQAKRPHSLPNHALVGLGLDLAEGQRGINGAARDGEDHAQTIHVARLARHRHSCHSGGTRAGTVGQHLKEHRLARAPVLKFLVNLRLEL